MNPFPLPLQGGQMAPEDGQAVEGGIVQDFLRLGQLHPEGPVVQDVLEPVHLRRAVAAVSPLRPAGGLEQTDLVVPAQGAGGHPRQARQLLNGVFHFDHLPEPHPTT